MSLLDYGRLIKPFAVFGGIVKLLIATTFLAASTFGAVVTYEARDAGAGPLDARPLSDAARDAFLVAITGKTSYLLDFESIPVQYAANINLTNMKLEQIGTTADVDGGVTKGSNFPPDGTLGYNTTNGGARFLRIVPIFDIGTAGARLVFDTPVEFFGAYFTGLGTAAGNLTVEFDNGGFVSLPVAGGAGGGVNFLGFTSFGAPFSSVDMVLRGVQGSRDIYAIDDIITGLEPIYAGVPEPGTFALGGLALAGLIAFAKRGRK